MAKARGLLLFGAWLDEKRRSSGTANESEIMGALMRYGLIGKRLPPSPPPIKLYECVSLGRDEYFPTYGVEVPA